MSGFHPTDLIREVKCRPPIYNRDLLELPRREHKHQLWLEVAENLTHPEDWVQYTDVEKDARIDEIQCKWKHLKDHFHREIKVIEAGDAHKKRKYVYFDDMEFMRPFVGFKLPPIHKRVAKQETIDFMREPLDNVAGSDMESFLITNEVTGDEMEATPSKRPKLSIKSTPPVTQKQTTTPVVRKGQKDGGIKHFEFLRKSSKGTGPNPTFKIRDGDISFCLSLVPNLRKMGDSKKLLAKIEILKVLHKYIDSIESGNFPNSSTKTHNRNNHTQNFDNDDDPDMQEDHLDEFDENGGGGAISIVKYEEYVDPLNGSGNTKTWWT